MSFIHGSCSLRFCFVFSCGTGASHPAACRPQKTASFGESALFLIQLHLHIYIHFLFLLVSLHNFIVHFGLVFWTRDKSAWTYCSDSQLHRDLFTQKSCTIFFGGRSFSAHKESRNPGKVMKQGMHRKLLPAFPESYTEFTFVTHVMTSSYDEMRGDLRILQAF